MLTVPINLLLMRYAPDPDVSAVPLGSDKYWVYWHPGIYLIDFRSGDTRRELLVFFSPFTRLWSPPSG